MTSVFDVPAMPVLPPFDEFPSIPRLSREMIVTEKLDGTNAQILVTEEGHVLAGSRTRWLTPDADNFGFARWAAEHEQELRDGLGVGRHFGEWFGRGIQRGYGLTEKRFALFNTSRWASPMNLWARSPAEPVNRFQRHLRLPLESRCIEVPCCHVVPVLEVGTFSTERVDQALDALAQKGSRAVPGFMKPEGVVVFHVAANAMYKKTLDKNDGHKGPGAHG